MDVLTEDYVSMFLRPTLGEHATTSMEAQHSHPYYSRFDVRYLVFQCVHDC